MAVEAEFPLEIIKDIQSSLAIAHVAMMRRIKEIKVFMVASGPKCWALYTKPGETCQEVHFDHTPTPQISKDRVSMGDHSPVFPTEPYLNC